MMHRALYNTIKSTFVANVSGEDLTKFMEFPLTDKVAVVTELINDNPSPFTKGAGERDAKCYVYIMHLAMKQVLPDTPELYKLKEDLGIPVVSVWPKANPPTTEFALFSEKHQPSWTEEVSAIASAASLLSFESAENYDDIVAAIKTSIGVGGMEDLGDGRTIGKKDPTLELAVRYAHYSILKTRPEWCSPDGQLLKVLPEGADPRPKYVLDAEADAAARERRAELAKKANAERNEKLKKEYEGRKEALFKILDTFSTNVVVNQWIAAGFEAFKTMTVIPEGKSTWVPEELLAGYTAAIPADDLPEDKEAAQGLINEKFSLIEEYLFKKVNEQKPSWFRHFKGGSLGVRKIEGSDVVSETRAEGACRGGINKLFEKYGAAEVAKAVLAVFGSTKTAAEVFGELPTKSAIAPEPVVTE